MNQKRQIPRKVPKAPLGFTLVEIMIVGAIIGLLAAIAIPSYIRARTGAQTNACINNLRQIEEAIQQWATEMRKPQTAAVTFADITPYLRGDVVCPSAGGTNFSDSYNISDVATEPTCQVEPLAHVWMSSDLVAAAKPGSNGNHGHGHANGHGKGNGNAGGN